jgi:hypothetical protein
MNRFPLVDLALSRRLERAEGACNAAFVESRARLEPASGATWREFEGTYAMFDGVGSPLTQTFGLGLFATPTDAGFAAIESFFAERGAEVFHEVSPLADPALLGRLANRGYRPVELTSVMFQPLPALPAVGSEAAVDVRAIEAGDVDRWADTAAAGWGETPELAEFIRSFGMISARSEGVTCYLAASGGEPVAAAALARHGGVAVLAGASTVPAHRGRGAQGLLLRTRLRDAFASGCDVAMMCAQPGSASQRNAERRGFRIAYTRIKWQRTAK